MASPQVKQPDQARIVARLAAEWHKPVTEIAALYAHERAELAEGARLTNYLDIFATRRVLERIRKPGLPMQVPDRAKPSPPPTNRA